MLIGHNRAAETSKKTEQRLRRSFCYFQIVFSIKQVLIYNVNMQGQTVQEDVAWKTIAPEQDKGRVNTNVAFYLVFPVNSIENDPTKRWAI